MKIRIFLICNTICLLNPYLCFSSILQVPAVFPTIQSAVDNSEPGDTVLLSEGIYTEHVEVTEHSLTIGGNFILTEDTSQISVTRWRGAEDLSALHYYLTNLNRIRIIGIQFENCNREQNRETPFGGAISSYGGTSIAHLEYCKFINNRSYIGGGANLYGNYVLVSNCHFYNNYSGYVGGALQVVCSNLVLKENTFISNTSEWNAGGCQIWSVAEVEVGNNLFIQNTSLHDGGAMDIYQCGNVNLLYNDIKSNISGRGGGVTIVSAESLVVRSNRFSENYATTGINDDQMGAAGGLSLSVPGHLSRIEQNLFLNNTSDRTSAAIKLYSNSTIRNNIFKGNVGGGSILYTNRLNDIRPSVSGFGNLFINNQIAEGQYCCARTGTETTLVLRANDFISNGRAAGKSPGESELSVENNYWGDETGPYHQIINPEGLGDTVLVNTALENWSTEPFTNFQAPGDFSILQPEDGSIMLCPVDFQWEETNDTNEGDSLRYWLEISTDPEFDPDVTRKWKLGTTDHLDNLDLETGVYYWRVRCLDPLWLETLSRETWHFEVTEAPTRPDPPTLFNLLAPEDGVTLNDSSVRFAWEQSIIPNELGEVSYTLILNGGEELEEFWMYDTHSDTIAEITVPGWESLSVWYVAAVNDSADSTWSNQLWSFYATDVEEETHDRTTLPKTFAIESIHPQPFNSSVIVQFALPEPGMIQWEVVDLLGRKILDTSNRSFYAGYHQISMEIPNSSGTYFLLLTGPKGEVIRDKLVHVR
ncbi:hypothetical protein K8I28_10710 [bacterium]|nr:hypothetical protein [bacterium]